MSERTVVLFAGGGTGGHLYPALALAEALVELRPDVDPVFVGASRGIEARILPERGVEHLLLPVRGLQRGASIGENVGFLPALLSSLLEVGEWISRHRPGAVVVTGGYAGGPAGLVAAMRGIPLALQEQNAVPGATTRGLSRWATQIHLAFPEAAALLPESAQEAVRFTGNPIRPPVPTDLAEALETMGLLPDLPVVLVVGGSQGSAALNAAVLSAIRLTVEEGEGGPGFQLLWSTGPSHIGAIRTELQELGLPEWVQALGYLDRMPVALAAATVAVSRAGAMATSELLAWGVPAILVPLPTSAAGHQERNAHALAEAGCAVHLPESEMDGAALLQAIATLVGDPERCDRIGTAARARALPNAARDIAEALTELLPEPRRVA